MKYVIVIILTVFIISSCGNSSLEDDLYRVIKQDNNEFAEKSTINVELFRKTSEDTLGMIAKEIKDNNPNFSTIFIFYYTPDQSTNDLPWATTHYSPNLDIRIQGPTEKEEETAKIEKFGLSYKQRKNIYIESYKLEVEARENIREKYNISDSVYWEISTEGIEMNWTPTNLY